MGDLIWVGNTLLPRGVVIAAAVIILLVVAGGLTWATSSVTSKEEK
jgi:hypothetical protein